MGVSHDVDTCLVMQKPCLFEEGTGSIIGTSKPMKYLQKLMFGKNFVYIIFIIAPGLLLRDQSKVDKLTERTFE